MMERWKINLYTIWVTQVFSLMGFGLAVPFIPYYLQELGVVGSSLNFYVGLASTLPAAAMAISAPIWGAVSDIYGRKMMLMRAMVASTVILVFMGMANVVWLFMVLRALQGVFSGTITASMAFVSANTPENKMSFALGFMTSSNFLGYSIGPFIGGVLAEVIGYKACFVVGGIIMFVGFIMVLLLVKEDPNTYGQRLKDSDKYQKSEGEKVKLLTPFIISILLALFVTRLARTIFTPFIAIFVQESLGTLNGAATYTGIINGATGVATAIAAITITRLGDRYNKFNLAFVLTLISVPISILLVPKYALGIFVIVYSLYFFIAGSVEPILTSAASEATNYRKKGALFGILGTVNSVSMMISPMAGAGVSAKFGIHAILILMPIFTVIQLIILYINKKKAGA